MKGEHRTKQSVLLGKATNPKHEAGEDAVLSSKTVLWCDATALAGAVKQHFCMVLILTFPL